MGKAMIRRDRKIATTSLRMRALLRQSGSPYLRPPPLTPKVLVARVVIFQTSSGSSSALQT
jgi:hypothetical protein